MYFFQKGFNFLFLGSNAMLMNLFLPEEALPQTMVGYILGRQLNVYEVISVHISYMYQYKFPILR